MIHRTSTPERTSCRGGVSIFSFQSKHHVLSKTPKYYLMLHMYGGSALLSRTRWIRRERGFIYFGSKSIRSGLNWPIFSPMQEFSRLMPKRRRRKMTSTSEDLCLLQRCYVYFSNTPDLKKEMGENFVLRTHPIQTVRGNRNQTFRYYKYGVRIRVPKTTADGIQIKGQRPALPFNLTCAETFRFDERLSPRKNIRTVL